MHGVRVRHVHHRHRAFKSESPSRRTVTVTVRHTAARRMESLLAQPPATKRAFALTRVKNREQPTTMRTGTGTVARGSVITSSDSHAGPARPGGRRHHQARRGCPAGVVGRMGAGKARWDPWPAPAASRRRRDSDIRVDDDNRRMSLVLSMLLLHGTVTVTSHNESPSR